METMLDNLLNGNISTAKRQAKRRTVWDIRNYLIEMYGWSEVKATFAADFLKGRDCWQAYCDAP